LGLLLLVVHALCAGEEVQMTRIKLVLIAMFLFSCAHTRAVTCSPIATATADLMCEEALFRALQDCNELESCAEYQAAEALCLAAFEGQVQLCE